MKKTAVIICLLVNCFAFCQNNTYETIIKAYETKNKALLQETVSSFEDVNACFSYEGKEYNLACLFAKIDYSDGMMLLQSKKADLNASCSGKTPLMYAAKYGSLNSFQLLLRYGAVSSKTYKGRQAIDYARKYNRQEIITYFQNYKP